MQTYTVDSRSNQGYGACDVCCCMEASARPGEVNKWRINYAPWVVPMMGKGLVQDTVISIEHVNRATTNAPIIDNGFERVVFNTAYLGDLKTLVPTVTPTMTFAPVALFGVKFGSLVINNDGTYTYTPGVGYTGYDTFYYSVRDGDSAPAIAQVILAVDPAAPKPQLPQIAFLDNVEIPGDRVRVDQRGAYIDLPVAVSPAAVVGDVYRITIKQGAADCDWERFYHVSCYDLVIGKC